MLTDEEWRRAYAYLLEQVSALADSESVAVELQQVTRLRFENDLKPEEVRRSTKRRGVREVELEQDLFATPRAVEYVGPPEKRVEKGWVELDSAGIKSERQDLDTVRNRAPTSREVFLASIDVLTARLREFPALAARLQILLNRPPERLQWLPDAGEDEFASSQETFNARDFSLDEEERSAIEIALRRLEIMLNEER